MISSPVPPPAGERVDVGGGEVRARDRGNVGNLARRCTTMRYTVSVPKKALGASLDVILGPGDRKSAIAWARAAALASFTNAELCKISVVEFHEWGASDLSAARITLDIGGDGYGDANEVTS